MDPLTIGLITGGANLLGSLFSSSTSAANTQANIAMQQQANQFNAEQAQLNRDFQAQMSNTAYQRASKDMQAAGLNPMMMFGFGSAASSPSGSVATGGAARSENVSPLAGLGDVIGKALSTASAVKQMDKMQADIDLTRAQKHATDESALKTNLEGIGVGRRLDLIPPEIAIRKAEQVMKENDATTARNIGQINDEVRKRADQAGYIGRRVGQTLDAVPVVSNAAKAVKALRPKRSTVERSSTGPAGDTSSFEERFHY